MWYEWESLENFNLWHNALCLRLNYPIIPVNQETGLPDETAQKVVAYTTPIEVENKIIAWVDENESEGLIATDLRPPVRDISEI